MGTQARWQLPQEPALGRRGEPWSRGCVRSLLLPSFLNPGKEQLILTAPGPHGSQWRGGRHCQMGLLIRVGSVVFLMQMRTNKSIREIGTTNRNSSGY